MAIIKLGIAGCGVIGQKHARFASEHQGAVVHAVADLREEAAQRLAHQYSVPRVYPSAQAMLEDDELDAVVVAMPTGARGTIGEKALRRGKHVLLEKPPAASVSVLRQMKAVGNDRIVACASSRCRHTPSARAAHDFLADGEPLGRIRHVRARGVVAVPAKPEKLPPAWRLNRAQNGGGILVNWGVYDLDYLLGLLDWRLRPQRVLARAWSIAPMLHAWVPPGPDAETHLTAMVVCDNDVALTLERGEYMSTIGNNAWEIIGERATLRLWMIPGNDKQLLIDRAGPNGVTTEVLWQGVEGYDMLHRGVMFDFIDAIRAGRQPATNLAQAIQLQELMDAVYRSAEAGEAVAIGG